MKTESDFNAALSKVMAALRPDVFHLKASDRFQRGVSDFLAWRQGKPFALECKFAKTLPPSYATKILKHAFTGEQRTFFANLRLSGVPGFGVVAIGEIRTAFLIKARYIPESGNITKVDLIAGNTGVIPFTFDRLDELVHCAAGWGL